MTYLANALRGDFGPSYRSRSQSVSDIIREFLPVSLQLGAAAMLLAVIVALPLGGLAAVRRGTWVDWIIVSLTTMGISLPSYVVASVLIVVLGVKLGWVPTIGWDGLFTASSIVPIIGLALAPLAALTRYFRASMIEEIHRDYVRTARAKGLSERTVVAGHMARNALIPVATVAGVYFSYVLMGSFFVETIAGVPGSGTLLRHLGRGARLSGHHRHHAALCRGGDGRQHPGRYLVRLSRSANPLWRVAPSQQCRSSRRRHCWRRPGATARLAGRSLRASAATRRQSSV